MIEKEKNDKIIDLAIRKGFFWKSFELYGGSSGFWDYGPLGSIFKKNILDEWIRIYRIEEGFLEVDTPTINLDEVFIASGHVKNFVDIIVKCDACNEEYRADHLIKDVLGIEIEGTDIDQYEDVIKKNNLKCPACGGKLGRCQRFNLMFETKIGAGGNGGKEGYLRPETAQGIFINFLRLSRLARTLPFGVVQVGKAYRNEISPRQGIIRLREFTLAEAEIFIDPNEDGLSINKVANNIVSLYPRNYTGSDERGVQMTIKESLDDRIIQNKFVAYNIAIANKFLTRIGISNENIRFRQHKTDEMAHYASDCWDAEIKTDRYGWIEVAGIADRGNYDLKSHSIESGQDLYIFKPFDKPIKAKRKVIKPDMNKIGPKFKNKSPLILEKLKNGEDIVFKGKDILLTIGDEKVIIDDGSYSIEEVEEEVHGEKIIPHVVEPSYGIDRILYCLLEQSYREEMLEDGETRIVLSFKAFMSPINVAVFPLLPKKELIEKSREVEELLKKCDLYVSYDDSGSIGRRYRRHDEAGTPFCVTIDFETLDDNCVTVRDRDTMKQKRVNINDLGEFLNNLIVRSRLTNSILP